MLHPWPRTHKRREPGLEDRLKALQHGDVASLVDLFVRDSDEFAVPLDSISQFLNLSASEARAALQRAPGLKIMSLDGEEICVSEQKWARARDALVAALGEFHAAHPLAPGRDMEELRDKLPGRIPAKLFRAFVDQLEVEKLVARDGNLLRLPEHTIAFRDDEQRLVNRIRMLLSAHPLAPPDLKELEKETGTGRAKLTEVLRVLERKRSVVRVSADLYFLAETIDGVRTTLREKFSDRSDITPAIFRDHFSTTRKYTIPLLEYLDREGVTVRSGDTRRLKTPGAREA